MGFIYLYKEDFVDKYIYILYWDINVPYIGQTIQSINTRKTRHYNDIKIGSHCNYKILQEYKKYGIMPTIECLDICKTKEELDYLEKLYIKEFNSIDSGLNILSGGYSVGSGVNNSSSKYTKEPLISVFMLLASAEHSHKFINISTGVPITTVKKIGQGAQHNWLQEEFPEVYTRIQEANKLRYTISASARAQGKKYRRIQAPSGEIFVVDNTLEFSNKYGLPNGNLCSVLLGKRASVKGWKGIL